MKIAFYDGSKKEKRIINACLHNIEAHISYARYVRNLIGIFDALLVKVSHRLDGPMVCIC